MNRYQEADSILQRYLRLTAFPIALRMVEREKDLPRSFRALMAKSLQAPACQLISYTRRYGWKVLIRREDNTCPMAALALGFVEPKEELMDGRAEVPAWVLTQEARAKVVRDMPKLDYDAFRFMIAAPLEEADFEPHLTIVYGNPAQMMRLVQSAICKTGDSINGNSLGAVGCSGYITRALLSEQCQMVVSGAGDRIFAQTQDHEMCFSIPMARMDEILTGLEETYKHGMRFPTPSYLLYQPKLPPSYSKMMYDLSGETEPATP